jgi:hypothetical protein
VLGRLAPSLVCLLLSVVACGGSSVGTSEKWGGLPRSSSRGTSKPKVATRAQPLTAHRFAEVSDVIGPYVGRDGDLALAAWGEASSSGRSLFAAPVDAAGMPGKPTRLGTVAPELDLVLVRGLGSAAVGLPGKPRFALVTTRRREERTSIDVTATTAAGVAVFGPTNVAERTARVIWVGFAVTAGKPLVLWAEQVGVARAGEPASIYAQPLVIEGAAAPAVLVTSKACVWQVASVGDRAALATVKPSNNSCATGSVALDLLGASGKADKTVELGGRAALDLDLVAGPDAFVLAWSDQSQLEPRAVTALVDAKGAVRAPPAGAVPVLGEQAVVALAPGSSAQTPAFLVWENLAERPEGARFYEISALDAKGRANGAHARILYARVDGGAPELAAYAGGVAALTLAPACNQVEACDGNLPVPTFVALDATLKVRASEPLVLDALGGRAADLGWGLTCHERGCFALAAPSRSPATLYTVPLPLRENQYRAAAEQAAPAQKPRVVSSEVLLRAASPLSQIAYVRAQNRELVGYVTDFDPTTPWQKLTKPAEDGRLEPLRARVALRAFEASGVHAPAGEEQVVSLRAHSLGGLVLLSESPTAKDALSLWVGLDKGEPQVFLTQLGEAGKRGQQRMLTRKVGGASDVAGLSVDGGILVGWVDERSGDAEVYAQRVGRGLERASPEQRITTADGAAAELLLTRLGGKPYAIWTDARAAEEPGWADIYGAFLRPGDAARDGQEHRLSSTRPHSFSPQVAELGSSTVLAWLEEAEGDSPASVRLTTLSDTGDVTGGVTVVPLEAGAPRGLGLSCREGMCRVAVTLEVEGRGELHGLEWKPGSQRKLLKLIGLGGPGAAAVAPIVRDDFVYVADLRDGQGLVRRLGVEW